LIKKQAVGSVVTENGRFAIRPHAMDVLAICKIEAAIFPGRTFRRAYGTVILNERCIHDRRSQAGARDEQQDR
jgi:hypothetical protein